MNTEGLSKARLDRTHETMTRYVECGDVPGIVRPSKNSLTVNTLYIPRF